jgi:TM2 domain-containing membrane protein YozV
MEIVDENGNSRVNYSVEESKRVLAGVLGILFGYLGVHKFVLGYNKEGLIQILLTFISFGILSVIGLIEGIIYLIKTDEEFVEIYQNNHKGWL